MGKLVFLRRTPKEIEIFGGDVYFDIDGKNAGKLELTNKTIDLPAGEHKIKMYKSHMYDTFIGFAEEVIYISDDEELMVKYSAPMMVNQAGNMVISRYDPQKENETIRERENTINRDFVHEEVRKREQNEKYNNGVKTFIIVSVVIAILFGLIFGIYEIMLFDSIW